MQEENMSPVAVCPSEQDNSVMKGNVLVIGNSGVGKSTLINAVLGRELISASFGIHGTTQNLKIYEGDETLPFRVIDTVGFEPTRRKEKEAVRLIRKWSKNSTKKGKEDTQINVIWFCVDGTSSKLFPSTLKAMIHAGSIYRDAPIIVVVTKSYSENDRMKNIQMVNEAFSCVESAKTRLKAVIPVVAETYVLNENTYVAPQGIGELIEVTNEYMPEGLERGRESITRFILNRKRILAQSIVAAAVVSGTVVGAVPIPFADSAILTPVEILMLNSLSRLYEIKKDENTKNFLQTVIEAGAVGIAAKAGIDILKAIPVINIGASAVNAVVAGCIIAALGECTVYAFEQVILGKRTFADTAWVKTLIDSKFTEGFLEKVKKVSVKGTSDMTKKDFAKIITDIFFPQKEDKNDKIN